MKVPPQARLGEANASRIGPALWQGPKPPEGLELACYNVRNLVLCAQEYQPPSELFGGVRVLHAPFDDADRAPTLEESLRVIIAAASVARWVGRGQRTLVTCMQGRNRSGLVVALALHLIHGSTVENCVRFVQTRRPNALTNPHLVRAAHQLALVLPSVRHAALGC